jgi:PPOX class probable F420-dependent enzyme
MRVELTEVERGYVAAARVARLATVDPGGWPHVVAVCPVLDGDRLVLATDEETAKVRNIQRHPHVALAFDDYVEDWTALRQVMIRGTATMHDHGPDWDRGRALLYERFPQYESESPITAGGSVIVHVEIEQVASWGL